MKNVVYSLGAISTAGLQYLSERGINVINGPRKYNYDQIKSFKDEISVLIYPDIPFPTEILVELPNLKLIARCGVGVDKLPLLQLKEKQVFVTNTAGVNTDSVAELTVCLMLCLTHRVTKVIDLYKTGISKLYQDNLTGNLLKNMTVGLIGYGNISQKVEQILSVFGTDILIYNHRPKNIRYGCQVDLQELLANSDIVSLHIPLVEETRNLINSKTIAQMNDGVFLVNTSRGGLIEKNALEKGLRSGKIAGAALDTVDHEPLNPNSSLFKIPNLLITPHVGAQTTETIIGTDLMVAKEVTDFIKSGILQHRVI
ncbi:MAG: NAD(P)-dependent oxidoreductase [Liquorilactobacillus ghanensis]|jgi:D-3-phosphoglycerate dehydrogenase|uniref:NAD(P)-dependent oxidoreductase n=1 Tax=Liquorilactobacillus ghanensis TaxID=399370 RepID=UPI0039EA669D